MSIKPAVRFWAVFLFLHDYNREKARKVYYYPYN